MERETNYPARKFEVVAPRTPGAVPSVIGTADTLAEARAIARKYWRRDLKGCDVIIRTAATGRRVEFAGPAR